LEGNSDAQNKVWKNKVKGRKILNMFLRKIKCNDENWNEMDQDRVQWQTLLIMKMNLLV
jgi:hypothetical protein